MNKMNFTPFPILKTDRLSLRQITKKDLDEFFILKSDERLLKYYDAKAKTYGEARQFLDKINQEITENRWILWGITLENDKLIGSICFWNISEEQSQAEIGCELMADQQGKGIMQEAVKAVIEYGFKGMKLQTIEALPNQNNVKSINLLERSQFIRGENIKEIDASIQESVSYFLANNN